MLELRRMAIAVIVWLSVIGLSTPLTSMIRAEEPSTTSAENPALSDDKPNVQKIAPDKFSDVDKLTNLTIFTMAIFVLGVVALLALIVVGARRLRTMTRSPLLKSKYDELELLREKYRREVEGLDTPPPPSRESRR